MKQVDLHNLISVKQKKTRKRIGRGHGCGLGKTAGRGTKGQGSRSGGGPRPGFEGGHTPLYRLIPKLRGFKSRMAKASVVNLEDLERVYKANEKVSLKTLKEKGLIANSTVDVKILGQGILKKKLIVYIEKVSKSARSKIEKAGGSIVSNKKIEQKSNKSQKSNKK